MASIMLENITKKFGAAKAVEDISLYIDDGEFLVLLGPTGAGKTTTLRLIAGLETPDKGNVKINDKQVTRVPPAGRDIAMVFQEYSLYPHYSVYDNLAFPLRAPCRRLPEDQIKERVTQVARLLKIEEKLGNKSTNLSGGEMQRVSIGRALVREPAAFLMDEPLSSLDAKLREDLRVELKRIQMKLKATICYVTHDQIEATTMADRIGVLSDGHLIQVGTPQEIYKRPANTYVACRLGSPRINLLPCGALGMNNGPSNAVTMGIRPENIIFGDKGTPTRISSVEHLGTETALKLEIDGHKIAALAPPGKNFQKGQTVAVSVMPQATMYFDKNETRLRI